MNADRLSWKTIVSLGFAMFVAHVSSSANPYLIGALVSQSGLSPFRAGLIPSIELATYALVMFALAHRMHVLSTQKIFVLGAVVAVASGIASANATEYAWLLVLRAVGGVGFGLLFAAACASGSRASDSARLYAMAAVLMNVIYALHGVATGWIALTGGYSSVYAYTSVLLLFSLVLVRHLPDGPSSTKSAFDRRSVRPSDAWSLLVQMFALMCTVAVYAYGERIATLAGVSPGYVGGAISAAVLVGASGGWLAARGRVRWGSPVCKSGGFIFLAISAYMFAKSTTPIEYVAWIVLYNVAWCGLYALILADAGFIDATGRLASYVGTAYMFGYAASVFVGGALASAYGYSVIGWSCGIAALAGLVAIAAELRGQSRNARRDVAT